MFATSVDVIIVPRTKHHMSDEHWLGDPMLYLPHALIEKIA